MWCILQKEIQMCYCLKLGVASEESELWTLHWTTAKLIFSDESSDVITSTTHYSRCLPCIFRHIHILKIMPCECFSSYSALWLVFDSSQLCYIHYKKCVRSKYIYIFSENVRTDCFEGIVPCPHLVEFIVVSFHLCLYCISSVFLGDFGHHCFVGISFLCMFCPSYPPWYSDPNNLQLKSTCCEVSNEISVYFWSHY